MCAFVCELNAQEIPAKTPMPRVQEEEEESMPEALSRCRHFRCSLPENLASYIYFFGVGG